MTRRKAVHFGAGCIGRGLMGQLYDLSGYDIVFVDILPDLLSALNSVGAYTLRIVGRDACELVIPVAGALDNADVDAVAAAVAEADVVSTAVGAACLKDVAPTLAAGLMLRGESGRAPLNVLLCENLHDAGPIMTRLVREQLAAGPADAVLAATGIVHAVVNRMVPLPPPAPAGDLGARVAMTAEACPDLQLDAAALVGEPPEIRSVRPVTNFDAYVERKLYSHNCAHAALGYLGAACGYTYGYEALFDMGVRDVLDRVLAETGQALVARHGFDPARHAAYVADLLERFTNVELGDTCLRLARDPARKLAPGDRLVGAARLCESQGVAPSALAEVIATALRFQNADDAASLALHDRIERDGVDAVLVSVAGLKVGEPLHALVRAAYERGAWR